MLTNSASRPRAQDFFMQRTSAMSTHRRRLTAKTRWFSTCNQTIRHVVYAGNIHTDVLTHICRHPQFIMCFTLVMFTGHPEFLMFTHWSCLQASTINHVPHTSHVYRHPQFIMFMHWSCLQASTIHVHTLVMSTHIHSSSCSHPQASRIHHAHTIVMYTHTQFTQ